MKNSLTYAKAKRSMAAVFQDKGTESLFEKAPEGRNGIAGGVAPGYSITPLRGFSDRL
jgi:hypothetical protein